MCISSVRSQAIELRMDHLTRVARARLSERETVPVAQMAPGCKATRMAGFDNPPATWTARFASEGYVFGEEPNAFLKMQAHCLEPGGSVLCVADGEGRNSVWLA